MRAICHRKNLPPIQFTIFLLPNFFQEAFASTGRWSTRPWAVQKTAWNKSKNCTVSVIYSMPIAYSQLVSHNPIHNVSLTIVYSDCHDIFLLLIRMWLYLRLSLSKESHMHINSSRWSSRHVSSSSYCFARGACACILCSIVEFRGALFNLPKRTSGKLRRTLICRRINSQQATLPLDGQGAKLRVLEAI